MDYGLPTNSMTKIDNNNFSFEQCHELFDICFFTTNNGEADFYAETEDILEEALIEYTDGNLVTEHLMFVNIN